MNTLTTAPKKTRQKLLAPEMSRETWAAFFIQTYKLILAELKEIQTQFRSAPSRYPKAILAVEYFRLLRGEAFHNQRPPLVRLPGDKTPYQLEDELTKELEKVKALVDLSSGLAQHNLREIRKVFEVPSSIKG